MAPWHNCVVHFQLDVRTEGRILKVGAPRRISGRDQIVAQLIVGLKFATTFFWKHIHFMRLITVNVHMERRDAHREIDK